jgi:tetratricopeptide (TPR) repeat protein
VLLEAEGRQDEALELFRKDLAIAERLAAIEPNRADYAQDLAISLLKMARLEPEQAPDYLHRALAALTPFERESRLDIRGQRLLRTVRDQLAS